VADGTVRAFEGDLEDYRRLLLTRDRADAAPREGAGPNRRDERRAAAERRRGLEPLRKRVREAEARIAALTKELAAIETMLADPGTYGSEGRAVADLLRQQAELRGTLETAEREWLAAAQALEDAD
jgi:ATP-binding cassette subfamily F protein 3